MRFMFGERKILNLDFEVWILKREKGISFQCGSIFHREKRELNLEEVKF